MEVTKDMTPTYERDENFVIKYYVAEQRINAKELRDEKSRLRARIKEINEMLGET